MLHSSSHGIKLGHCFVFVIVSHVFFYAIMNLLSHSSCCLCLGNCSLYADAFVVVKPKAMAPYFWLSSLCCSLV